MKKMDILHNKEEPILLETSRKWHTMCYKKIKLKGWIFVLKLISGNLKQNQYLQQYTNILFNINRYCGLLNIGKTKHTFKF